MPTAGMENSEVDRLVSALGDMGLDPKSKVSNTLGLSACGAKTGGLPGGLKERMSSSLISYARWRLDDTVVAAGFCRVRCPISAPRRRIPEPRIGILRLFGV